MGCGASSEKGRESHSQSVTRAEPFFPPGIVNQDSVTNTPTTSPIKKTITQDQEVKVAKEEPVENTHTNTITEIDQPKTSPTLPKVSSPKKKSAYVPPAPITESVLIPTPTSPIPSSPASVEKSVTSDSPSLGDDERFDTAGEEESSYTPFDKFTVSDSLQGDDFIGLLDLDQSDFDHAAISVITSMTTTTKEAKSSVASQLSEFEYPTDSPEPNSSSGMRFDELYRLKGVLGTGAFSTVREGFHRNNQAISYAVKCINRKKLSDEDEAALLDEVSILKEMKHDHIIRLFDFFEEPATYYLIMERMRGGELFDRIVAKAYYNEKEARDTCKIVLEAVRYLHENHVAHRDLKPENLLLLSDVDDSAVKIADFGFAKRVYQPNSLTTQCGTPGYVAPEILEGTAYDERADMWSVGVILYILLGGYPPFIESTQRDLFRKIRKGDYEFHEEYWGTVSAEAKELISSLLAVDCKDRLTADEALENAWILGDDAKLASKGLGINLEKLKAFNGKRKFRAAVSTVMAVNKLNLMGKEFFSVSTSMKEATIK